MQGKYVPSVKRNIVLIRLFISILGISTIAVIAISTAIFFLFRSKTIEDIEASDRLALTNIQLSLDNVIDTTEKTIIETYRNPAVKRLIYENPNEWNDTMIATANSTLSTLSTYSFLNSIYIFRDSEILFKASNKGIPEDKEAKLVAILDHENPGTPVPWLFRTRAGEATSLLSIFIGEKSNATNRYESAIIGNVDMGMIHKAIFKEALGQGQEIFVVNKQGTILLHNDMEQYDKSAADLGDIRRIIGNDEENGSFTMKENGKKYNVGYVYSTKGNYYVIHKIEYNLSVAKLTEARNTTLIYGILVLLFVLVTSLYMSYKIYRPINTIFSNIRGLFIHVPQATANSNELQAMANATAKIIENMNSYDKHIENKAAIELFNLSRPPIKPEELEEILHRMKSPLRPNSEYAVIVLRVCNYKSFERNNTVQAIEYQLQSIGNMAADGLADHAACCSYRIDNEHAVLLASDSSKGPPLQELRIKKLMETASDAIYRVLGLEVTIGISGFGTEWENLVERYKEAYRLTNYRVTLGRRAVIDGVMLQTEAENDELACRFCGNDRSGEERRGERLRAGSGPGARDLREFALRAYDSPLNGAGGGRLENSEGDRVQRSRSQGTGFPRDVRAIRGNRRLVASEEQARGAVQRDIGHFIRDEQYEREGNRVQSRRIYRRALFRSGFVRELYGRQAVHHAVLLQQNFQGVHPYDLPRAYCASSIGEGQRDAAEQSGFGDS